MANARTKDTKPPDLADQLRRAIGGCGMSLNQLAKATGVNKGQLSRFMRNERSLTLPAAAKLCAHLGLYLTGPALDERG
jgi:transcriptional regulator with XRE-family HTH domain